MAPRGVAPSRRLRVGHVTFGQSKQRGQAQLSDRAQFPQAFQSLTNPAVTSNVPGVLTLALDSADNCLRAQGSPEPAMYDYCRANGVDLIQRNVSIGSMSLFSDAVGFPTTWSFFGANTTLPRGRRASYGAEDPGTTGTVIVENGYVYECTTGSDVIYALRTDGPGVRNAAGDVINTLDYVSRPTAALKATGASKPDFTLATAVGSTVMDGAIIWTNRGTAAAFGFTTPNAPFAPGTLIGGLNAFSLGFDPSGVIRRALRDAQALKATGVDKVIIEPCNGEGDTGGTSQANFQACHVNLAKVIRAQGYEVSIGLSGPALVPGTRTWITNGQIAGTVLTVNALGAQTGSISNAPITPAGQTYVNPVGGATVTSNGILVYSSNGTIYQRTVTAQTGGTTGGVGTYTLSGTGPDVPAGTGMIIAANPVAGLAAAQAARTGALAALASDKGVHAGADMVAQFGLVEGVGSLLKNGFAYPWLGQATPSGANDFVHDMALGAIFEGQCRAQALLAGL